MSHEYLSFPLFSSLVSHLLSLKRKIRSFTLIELLIVIAIIAILAGMLLPALNAARNKATAINCMGRMKQVGLAVSQYADLFNEFLPLGVSPYSVGSNPAWTEILTGQGLLPGNPTKADPQNKMIFRCPVIGHFGWNQWRYRSYGLRSANWKESPYTQTWISIKGIKTPSSVMYVADSFNTDKTQIGNFDGGFNYWYAYVATSDQCVAAPHNGSSNLWFVDGHLESLQPKALLAVEQQRSRDVHDKNYGKEGMPRTITVFKFYNSIYQKIVY